MPRRERSTWTITSVIAMAMTRMITRYGSLPAHSMSRVLGMRCTGSTSPLAPPVQSKARKSTRTVSPIASVAMAK